MGLYCSLSLTGVVGPGILSILAMAEPWADILSTGGDCFLCWGQSECLGVEWGFCLGFGFFPGGIRDHSGGICPGVRLILAVAAPEADIFSGGGPVSSFGARVSVWVLSEGFVFVSSWFGGFAFVWPWILSREGVRILAREDIRRRLRGGGFVQGYFFLGLG